MTAGQLIDETAKRWKSIATLVGVVVAITIFTITLMGRVDAGEKKDVKQDKMLVQLYKTVQRMDLRLESIDASLELALNVWGYDKEAVKSWKSIPTKPVIDSAKNRPMIGSQWIPYELFPSVGVLMTAVEDSAGYRIEQVRLWDMRKAK